jgi:diacylglycerol kinase family enzyme
MTERPQAVLLLNPLARRRSAGPRWAQVEPAVRERFDLELVELGAEGWQERIARAHQRGVRAFIAAGGDGTVNTLVNAIHTGCGAGLMEGLFLGAVGLGSSNDFHKPIGRTLHGVPIRLDLERATPRDLARARFVDPRGASQERLFAISASLGATAAANAVFNQGGWPVGWLGRFWVDGAITWSALRALACHRPTEVVLQTRQIGQTVQPRQPDLGARRVALSNLSVMKTPFLSGGLRYDLPIAPGDGLLAAHLCEGMTRLELLRTFLRLGRGNFTGTPKTHSWRTPRLAIQADTPFDLELDGELFRAVRVELDLLPQRVRCSP